MDKLAENIMLVWPNGGIQCKCTARGKWFGGGLLCYYVVMCKTREFMSSASL